MSSNQRCLSSGVQLSMCIHLFELLSNKCVRLGTIYVADCHVNIFIALANTKVTDGGHFCCLTAVNFIKRCQVAYPHTLFATIIQSSLHPERNLRGGQNGRFQNISQLFIIFSSKRERFKKTMDWDTYKYKGGYHPGTQTIDDVNIPFCGKW